MARDFNGSNQSLTQAAAIGGTYPFTFAGWFWVDGVAADYELFALNSTTNDEVFSLRASGTTGGDPLILQCIAGGSAAPATSATSITASAWYHAAGVCASATSRTVYLNGGGSATSSTNLTPAVTRTSLGQFRGASALNFLDGRLGEWGVWSAALDAAEILALARGFSPLLIRPASLLAYYPITGNDSPELDRWKNGSHLTLANAPTKIEGPGMFAPEG